MNTHTTVYQSISQESSKKGSPSPFHYLRSQNLAEVRALPTSHLNFTHHTNEYMKDFNYHPQLGPNQGWQSAGKTRSPDLRLTRYYASRSGSVMRRCFNSRVRSELEADPIKVGLI